MLCETYKQLQSELGTARGEWVYFTLTASKRAAGITEYESKDMVRRAKGTMESIKDRIFAHVKTCVVCIRTNDALGGAAS